MQRFTVAKWLLILALALVFGVFGVDKFLSPLVWIGWMPLWMEGLLGLSTDMWLRVVGALEIAVAVLLVIPVRRIQKIGAALACLQLLGVLSQTGFNDIAVRDAGLLLSSIALLLLI